MKSYPEITQGLGNYTGGGAWVPKQATPTPPATCPACGASSIEVDATVYQQLARYSCGGAYNYKSQIQNHTDKWWGHCGKI